MASRNQYVYSPGYSGPSRQVKPKAGSNRYGGARPGTPKRPAGKPKRRATGDMAILTLLFIVAPLCGILGVFVRAFLWVFIIIMVVMLAIMWGLKCFAPRGRAILSGILLILSAVALIAIIDLTPKDNTYLTYGGTDSVITSGDSGGAAQANAIPTATPGIDWSQVGNSETGADATQPSDTQDQTPAQDGTDDSSYAAIQGNSTYSEAEQVLNNYMNMWKNANYEDMVQYTLPSWRASQSNPSMQLYYAHDGWLLYGWSINREAVSSANDSVTITVVAEMAQNKKGDTSTVKKQYSSILFNISGTWYVDPDSMRSGIAVQQTQAPSSNGDDAANQATPTPTTDPSLKLWYNSDGGSYYHLEEKCSSINQKNYKFMKSFTYSQLNESTYSKLTNCSVCGAPRR